MRERGQAAAEFALLLPILALLVLGLLDFGRAFYQYIGAINAAREGARYCALFPQGPSETAAAARARTLARIVTSGTTPDTAELGGRFAVADVTVKAWLIDPVTGAAGAKVDHCPAGSVGQDVAVDVRIAFRAITPVIEQLFPQNPLPVGGGAQMQVRS